MGLISTLLESIPTLVQIFKKNDKPTLGFKHLILKSDDQIEKLLRYDYSFLDNLSSKKIYLLENDVFKFGQTHFRKSLNRTTYSGWEQTPYQKLAQKDGDKFTKHYKIDDFEKSIEIFDNKITGNIIYELQTKGNQYDITDFVSHNVYDFHCHGTIHDVIDFRSMWVVLLWIENMSQSPIPLEYIAGVNYENNVGLEYRNIEDRYGSSKQIDYPSNQVQPQENILVPQFFLLAPLRKEKNTKSEDIRGISWHSGEKSCSYSSLKISDTSRYNIIGPSFKVQKIKTRSDSIKVHDLDLNNLITINEYLNFGCCPYVFGIKKDNKVEFLGDILTNSYAKMNIKEYFKVMICELENETTFIDKILADGKPIASNKVLKKGDFITINNAKQNINYVEMFGYYIAEAEYQDTFSNFSFKHNLVMNTLNRLSS